MKYVSINASKTKGYGTICPEGGPNELWGRDVLDDMEFRKYCLLDPFTDKGLDEIATYNGYSDEWETAK